MDEASLMDLAPTILHYLGLPVPEHMDGKVLTEAFTEAFNSENPVQFAASDLTGGGAAGQVYGAEEEALVLEKLRGMGYVA